MHHLHCSTLDHIPLWIVLDGIETSRPLKPFRLEEMWLFDSGYSKTVEAIWINIDHMDL